MPSSFQSPIALNPEIPALEFAFGREEVCHSCGIGKIRQATEPIRQSGAFEHD
jgi:hypothetical protein